MKRYREISQQCKMEEFKNKESKMKNCCKNFMKIYTNFSDKKCQTNLLNRTGRRHLLFKISCILKLYWNIEIHRIPPFLTVLNACRAFYSTQI